MKKRYTLLRLWIALLCLPTCPSCSKKPCTYKYSSIRNNTHQPTPTEPSPQTCINAMTFLAMFGMIASWSMIVLMWSALNRVNHMINQPGHLSTSMHHVTAFSTQHTSRNDRFRRTQINQKMIKILRSMRTTEKKYNNRKEAIATDQTVYTDNHPSAFSNPRRR